MIRFAVLLILASAYFSPAHALSVDHLNELERNVPVLVGGDASNLELDALAEGLRLRDKAAGQSSAFAQDNAVGNLQTADSASRSQTVRNLPAERDNKIAAAFLTDQMVTVPLPGSFWLFAMALAAGLLLQRRQGVKER